MKHYRIIALVIQSLIISLIAFGDTSMYLAIIYQGSTGSFNILSRIWLYIICLFGISSNHVPGKGIWITVEIVLLVFIVIISKKSSERNIDLMNLLFAVIILLAMIAIYLPIGQFVEP